MKMICPQCGVKGSAAETLLNKKVKCPKCNTIFVVNADVITAIPVGEFELEQVEEIGEPIDSISEGKVDKAFDDIFGSGQEELPVDELDDSEIDKLLIGDTGDQEVDTIAALSDEVEEIPEDLSEDISDDLSIDEDIDSTLTVIEDVPEKTSDVSDETVGDESFLDEEQTELESGDFDWTEEDDSTIAPALGDVEESPGFDDESDGDEEVPIEEGGLDDQITLDDFVDDQEDDSLNIWEDDEKNEDNLLADGAEQLEDESDDSDTDEIELPFDDDSETVDEEPQLTEELAESELEASDDEIDIIGSDQSEEDKFDGEALLDEDQLDLDSAGKEASLQDEVELGDEKDLDDADEEHDAEIEQDGPHTVALVGEGKDIEEGSVEKCSACGEYVDQSAKYKLGRNVYCTKCVPRRDKKKDTEQEESQTENGDTVPEEQPVEHNIGRFTLTTLIKDSWSYTKGVKGSIWVGMIVMYLLLIALGTGAAFALPGLLQGQSQLNSILINAGLQICISFLSFVLSAGIIVIAVNKIGGKTYSWKQVFSGFNKFGSLLLLYILLTIMMVVGFCLFVIPGIYLAVGYTLAIPLVMVKGLSPWAALEESRKAIHTRWWTVFFSFIVMSIIVSLSMIPLLVGLIWTIPMFVVLIGILYYHFFGDTGE